MPTEAEMLPKDKYTMFDRKEKRYRKGIHSRSLHHSRSGGGPAVRVHVWNEVDADFTVCLFLLQNYRNGLESHND